MILFQKEKLNKTLKAFYKLTGVRIALFNEWHCEIAAYPKNICSFCEKIRQNEQFRNKCIKSDKKAFEIVTATHQQYTYQCHAGLYESMCPIIIEDHIVGFLMIGQFVKKNTDNTTNRIYDIYTANELNLNVVFDPEGAEAIAFIMSICAEYLCFSKIVSTKNIGRAAKAQQYIDEHIGETISVQHIADILGLSRTPLYLLFKKEFGKGVTEYINYRKTELAKAMVKQHIPTCDIIEKINISDANYFYRLFKKHAGISFAEYKNQN